MVRPKAKLMTEESASSSDTEFKGKEPSYPSNSRRLQLKRIEKNRIPKKIKARNAKLSAKKRLRATTDQQSSSEQSDSPQLSLPRRKKKMRLNSDQSSEQSAAVESDESVSNSSSESEDDDEISEKSKQKNHRDLSKTESDSESNEEEDEEAQSRKTRKSRRKKIRPKEKEPTPGGRKKIRHIIADDALQQETKEAEKREQERLERLKKQADEKIVDVDLEESVVGVEPVPITKRLVLQKDPLVEVHPGLAIPLKPHQVEGIQFIWDNLIENTKNATDESGGGCILAHCMGLGKTLQTVTVLHTILRCKHLSLKTAVVVAPLNTLLNWIAEFVRWVPDNQEIDIYNLSEHVTRKARLDALKKWQKNGGVMVMGYDMFRLLATGKGIRHKPTKLKFAEMLVDPGPDIVVCDEGHKLKNSEANISVTMNNIKTRRRLVLTGTPLQNNLVEYHCMVNFVKPNLLGTLKEFRNRFANPISNGQHSDSTKRDVRLMKNRCHILHEMLIGFVQRKDYTALAQYLCDKVEYIVKVRLSPLQVKLYRHYLDSCTNRGSNPNAIETSSKDTGLFADYQTLMRVWTHPRVLRLHTKRQENMAKFLYDDEDSEEAMSTDAEDANQEAEQASPDQEADKTAEEKSPPSPKINGVRTLDDTDDDESDKNDQVQDKKRKTRRLKDSDEDDNDDNNSGSDVTSEEEQQSGGSECEFSNTRVEQRRTRYKLRGAAGDDAKQNRKTRYRLRGGNSDSSGNEAAGDGEEKEGAGQADSDTWYSNILPQQTEQMTEKFEDGGKIMLLFEILRMTRQCNDKILVFSQSLLSLDLIEEMLLLSSMKVDAAKESGVDAAVLESLPEGFYQTWYKNIDYFRMDGSSLGKSRQRWINEFNDVSDERARLFLISTKAGSLGVNLVAANRVVIFDASWNPTHDVQSIFRVYRFGQTKTCYIYRLIAQGTMEEKIYDRQVTKQSLAFRVVDEQQINRHFRAHDLQELYCFNPLTAPEKDEDLPVHALPKDPLLAELLVGVSTKRMISSYHKHDSLLDHQETEELTEEERKAAWEEYENEKKGFSLRSSKPLPTLSSMPLSISALSFVESAQQQQQQLFSAPLSTQDVRLLQGSAFANGGSSPAALISAVFLPSIASLPPDKQSTARSCLSFMIKASEGLQETSQKIQGLQPVDINKTVEILKQLPMYRNIKAESIRMLAVELQVRQQQSRLSAEKVYKHCLLQMEWFESKIMKLFYDSSIAPPNFVSALQGNSQMPQLIEPTVTPAQVDSAALSQSSAFARSSFADMVASAKAHASSQMTSEASGSGGSANRDGAGSSASGEELKKDSSVISEDSGSKIPESSNGKQGSSLEDVTKPSTLGSNSAVNKISMSIAGAGVSGKIETDNPSNSLQKPNLSKIEKVLSQAKVVDLTGNSRKLISKKLFQSDMQSFLKPTSDASSVDTNNVTMQPAAMQSEAASLTSGKTLKTDPVTKRDVVSAVLIKDEGIGAGAVQNTSSKRKLAAPIKQAPIVVESSDEEEEDLNEEDDWEMKYMKNVKSKRSAR